MTTFINVIEFLLVISRAQVELDGLAHAHKVLKLHWLVQLVIDTLSILETFCIGNSHTAQIDYFRHVGDVIFFELLFEVEHDLSNGDALKVL